MKIVLLFTLSISFNSECFSQFNLQGKNTVIEQKALMKKNRIKSMIIFMNDTSAKISELKKWYQTKYDINGNEIAIIQSNPYNEIADSMYYDAYNNIIKWIIFNEKTIISYSYDTQNRIIQKTDKSFNDSIEKETVYIYDSLGNNNAIIESYPNNIKEKSILKYDNAHNLTEWNSNEDKARILYKYDLNSNEIECIRLDKNGVISFISISTYNENNMIEYISFEYGYLNTHRYFEYDIQGNLTKDILEKNIGKYGMGHYGSTTIYKYNSEGLLTEETHFSDSPTKIKTSKKYVYEKY